MATTRMYLDKPNILLMALGERELEEQIYTAMEKTRSTGLESFFEVTYIPGEDITAFSDVILGGPHSSNPKELRAQISQKYGQTKHHPILFAHTHPISKNPERGQYSASMRDLDAGAQDFRNYLNTEGRLANPPIQAVISVKEKGAGILLYQFIQEPGDSYDFLKWHDEDMTPDEKDMTVQLLMIEKKLRAKNMQYPYDWNKRVLREIAGKFSGQ